MKHRPKHVAEYVLLRSVCGLVALLPYRLALALAWGIARLAFSVFRWRRREAIRRIQSVLGGTPREARRIAWQSLRNMAFSLAEMIYMGGARPRPLPRPVDMQAALERFRAYTAANPGRGGIFACPHMGNWELAGVVAPTCQIDMFTITGLQKNPLVNAYLQQLRHAPGVELLERGTPNLLRKVLAYLRAGKFLAIMPDLRSRQPGVPVRFFGGEVNLYPGTAQFARQAGIPVFLAVMKRHGWTRHALELHGPFEPDPALPKDEDIARLSQTVMDLLDADIRKDPGQWFWYNKRWILDPPDA
jgi:Kdo2-lipid IVA lauroyltransferase/acyltransferase